MSTDESQSTSPDDNVSSEASPRINRFLARLPPDGCEKVYPYIFIISIFHTFANAFLY